MSTGTASKRRISETTCVQQWLPTQMSKWDESHILSPPLSLPCPLLSGSLASLAFPCFLDVLCSTPSSWTVTPNLLMVPIFSQQHPIFLPASFSIPHTHKAAPSSTTGGQYPKLHLHCCHFPIIKCLLPIVLCTKLSPFCLFSSTAVFLYNICYV